MTASCQCTTVALGRSCSQCVCCAVGSGCRWWPRPACPHTSNDSVLPCVLTFAPWFPLGGSAAALLGSRSHMWCWGPLVCSVALHVLGGRGESWGPQGAPSLPCSCAHTQSHTLSQVPSVGPAVGSTSWQRDYAQPGHTFLASPRLVPGKEALSPWELSVPSIEPVVTPQVFCHVRLKELIHRTRRMREWAWG